MAKSCIELHKLCQDQALKRVPILVFINKQDLNVNEKGVKK